MYKINAPDIIYDCIDGNVIIIDGVKGLYYALSGYSTYVFCALCDGCSVDSIIAAFKGSGINFGFDAVTSISDFTRDMLDAGIIVEIDKISDAVPGALAAPPVEEPPHLTCFTDLQDLLTIDPIHQVDVQEGWPFTDKA